MPQERGPAVRDPERGRRFREHAEDVEVDLRVRVTRLAG